MSGKILDIFTSPWAIQPEKLLEIQAIYATHLRGNKIDLAAIEAAIGRPLNNEPKPYQVVDGVAIIQLHGVVAKRMNLFSRISGGVSTEAALRDLNMALDDPEARSILLHIDSPGGTVDGTQTLADAIYAARGEKKIVALADGLMASAAVWFGSAASEVYITDNTTHVGSIGVVTTHIDVSKAEEKLGRKTTEIYAGKFKRIDSSYKPLSNDGKAYLQESVDYIYSIFVGDVARNRGVSVDKVLEDMADGRLFIGQQAIEAGLVDGVSTMEALIAKLNEADAAGVAPFFASDQQEMQMSKENESKKPAASAEALTVEAVREQAPDVAEALVAEGRKDGMAAGAAAERARIQAVKAQSMPGHEALIESMMFDGETTGEQAAVKVLNAERKQRTDAAADYEADARDAQADFSPAPDKEGEVSAASGSIEDQARANWAKNQALHAEFGSIDTYIAGCKAHGKVLK